jgi:hypothetical protein
MQTSRPRPPIHRHPAKDNGILTIRVPFTVAKSQAVTGIAPSAFLRRSPAHAAHTFSTVCGEVLGWALQALAREGYPRRAFERTGAFMSPLDFDAWD